MAPKIGCGRITNRDRILQCAKELFLHVGYQATSIDDIIKECGVAKSNFYYHFESKELLASAVLDCWVGEYEMLVAHTLRNMDFPPVLRMERFFACVSQVQAEVRQMSGCPFGNFAATLASINGTECEERFRQRLSALFDEMESAMQDCLTEGIAAGSWRSDIAPCDMAAFLNASIQGLLMLTKTHRDTAPLFRGLAVVQKLLKPQ